MFVLYAHFDRLQDISLVDAYDRIGTYVLWSSRASIRPSYIGEGNVLQRFVSHMNKPWVARPLSGTMAFLEDGTRRVRKCTAELLEVLLLDVAEEIDRYPPNNGSGKRSSLKKILDTLDHNATVVRARITGRDPFLPGNPPLESFKQITLRKATGSGWQLEHDWNRRPGS